MSNANKDVWAALTSQRACRHFTADPVPSTLIDEVLNIARWTGSARNRQPWRFAVVTSSPVRQQLSRLGRYAQHVAHAPAVIAVASDPVSGGADTEFDIGRACQNITTAATIQSLGSCPATLHPAENARAAAQLLGLDGPWECRHAVSLGYPAAAPAGTSAIPAGRRPIEELVIPVPDG